LRLQVGSLRPDPPLMNGSSDWWQTPGSNSSPGGPPPSTDPAPSRRFQHQPQQQQGFWDTAANGQALSALWQLWRSRLGNAPAQLVVGVVAALLVAGGMLGWEMWDEHTSQQRHDELMCAYLEQDPC
jgi:hypothetical protein